MKLYYFYDHHGNFGDALNDWMWDSLLPDREDHSQDVWISGIGTILNHKMPKGRSWAVMGSGIGYGAPPVDFGDKNWKVFAVRGPLSARVLGLPPEKAITDAAMLLSLLPEYASSSSTHRSGVAFMPHYMSMAGGRWEDVCLLAGIDFIDPCSDTKLILSKIKSAKLVIADAMHGAIVADTLRTPWIAASLNSTTDSFKWNDWCASMEVKHLPHRIPSSTLSDYVKSRSLRMYGEHMLMDGADHDALVLMHSYRSKVSASASAQLGFKVSKRLVREVSSVSNSIEQRFMSKMSQGRMEHAAETLRAIANFPSTLSKDSVFSERREQMSKALSSLADNNGVKMAGSLLI